MKNRFCKQGRAWCGIVVLLSAFMIAQFGILGVNSALASGCFSYGPTVYGTATIEVRSGGESLPIDKFLDSQRAVKALALLDAVESTGYAEIKPRPPSSSYSKHEGRQGKWVHVFRGIAAVTLLQCSER